MAANIIQLADAVLSDLNGESFSQAFTAVRAYRPTKELQDLKTLYVTVVPAAMTEAPDTRATCRYDCEIHIGIQKKLQDPAQLESELDDLMALVDEIAAYLAHRQPSGFGGASWLATRHDPIFEPDHLEELRQFTAVLTVVYRIFG